MISSRSAIRPGTLAASSRLGRPRAAGGNLRSMAAKPSRATGADSFIESLMDTSLYSMGAYFSDEHPDLVDEVIAESEAIERAGLRAYADSNDMTVEACFESLLTGLAVRYYNAVAACGPSLRAGQSRPLAAEPRRCAPGRAGRLRLRPVAARPAEPGA